MVVYDLRVAVYPHHPIPLSATSGRSQPQHRHEYVPPPPPPPPPPPSPPSPLIQFLAEYTQNPFASTHSLDANPFDDPGVPRSQDLERRERDLERREHELNQRAEHIRKHGRNNWPPCSSSFTPLFRSVLMSSSLPPHLPLHFRRDPRRFSSPHHPSLSTMARTPRHPRHQHVRLHLHPRCRRE